MCQGRGVDPLSLRLPENEAVLAYLEVEQLPSWRTSESPWIVEGYPLATHPDLCDRVAEVNTAAGEKATFRYLYGAAALIAENGVIVAFAAGTSTRGPSRCRKPKVFRDSPSSSRERSNRRSAIQPLTEAPGVARVEKRLEIALLLLVRDSKLLCHQLVVDRALDVSEDPDRGCAVRASR